VAFTVSVTPQGAGTPTGTVTVSTGSKVLCTVTLAMAAGNCTTTSQALGACSTP